MSGPKGPIVSKRTPFPIALGPRPASVDPQLGWSVLVGALNASKEGIWLQEASNVSQENPLW